MRVHQLKTLAAVLVLASGTSGSSAQDYTLAEWKQSDGLPSGRIYAITQTPEGFLWLGTADGLVRYDGARFVQRSFQSSGLRPLGQVSALTTSEQGVLFAGTAAGLIVKVDDGHAKAVSVGNSVLSLSTLNDTEILVRTIAGVQTLKERTLILTSQKSEIETPLSACSSARQVSSNHVCLKDGSGTTWIGTNGDGLFAMRNGRQVARYTRLSGLTNDHITALFEDREANIWVGTQDGLNRLRLGKFQNSETNVSAALPSVLAAGLGGTLWVGSDGFLQQRLSSGEIRTVLRGPVSAVTTSQTGSVAIASRNRLYVIPNGMGEPHLLGQVRGVQRIAWVAQEGLWVEDKSGLQLLNGKRAETKVVLPAGTDRRDEVLAMAAQGDMLWLAMRDGTLLRVKDGQTRTIALPVLSPQFTVSYMTPHLTGGVWLATDAGLLLYQDERFLKWDRTAGLPGDRLQWVVEDGKGALWIGYSIGIAHIAITDLVSAAEGGTVLHPTMFNAGDGLEGSLEVRGQQPVAVDQNGAVWFTISEGLSKIDSAHLPANLLPPQTRILEVVVDGHMLPASQDASIAPHSRTLQIAYAGLSLADPAKNRYRYRLVGFDDAWQEAGDRRTAFYNDLKPGDYTFEVVSSNNDGVWGKSSAKITLHVEPTLYQRLWFRLLGATVVLVLAALAYRRRMQRQKRVLQQLFEARIAERNRLAGNLHDHLIQEMMGVGLQLEIANAATPEAADAKPNLRRALALIRLAIGDGRGTLQELRGLPSTWGSLERRLREIADFEDVSGGSLTFVRTGKERPLRSDTARDLLMIVQEMLRNALRHAPGSDVRYCVSFEKELMRVMMSDTGPGIVHCDYAEQQPGHFGLRGMQERAEHIGATLQQSSPEAGGTTWILEVPGAQAYAPSETPGL